MSRFCPLFSSSKGNSTYLSGGGSALLIDAGVSLRQLRNSCSDLGLSLEELQGVLITHEHSDHIKGLKVLLKQYPVPVYTSRGTMDYLLTTGTIPTGVPIHIMEETTEIGGILVTAFETPHDASHSVGYRFEMPDGRTVALATDLGHITDLVRRHITTCDLVMLESNYDPRMLDCSPYPYYLKRRIKGDFGHLSNEICSQECIRLIQNGTTRLVLGHLSEQNNLPQLAYHTAKNSLDDAGMRENVDYILKVAPARGAAEIIVF